MGRPAAPEKQIEKFKSALKKEFDRQYDGIPSTVTSIVTSTAHGYVMALMGIRKSFDEYQITKPDSLIAKELTPQIIPIIQAETQRVIEEFKKEGLPKDFVQRARQTYTRYVQDSIDALVKKLAQEEVERQKTAIIATLAEALTDPEEKAPNEQ
jgi:hypothetical protein